MILAVLYYFYIVYWKKVYHHILCYMFVKTPTLNKTCILYTNDHDGRPKSANVTYSILKKQDKIYITLPQ
jgi:hypothetical protein